MPRTCTICTHPERSVIDRALVAGEPFRNVAERTGTSATALHRHKAEHLPRLLAKVERTVERTETARAAALVAQGAAQEAQVTRHALDVVGQLKIINASSLAILREARERQAGDLALKAIDRIQKQIELQAKLIGELDERPVVNILVTSEWQAVRHALVAALAPYPEARANVAAALVALEAAG